MLGLIDNFSGEFSRRGIELTAPDVVQMLSEEALIEMLPDHDGWIIGDDPASRMVLEKGRKGRLRAAVKWGVGVDNVDFAACADLGIDVCNTPHMFGAEVADLALGYVIALARHTFEIDRGVRAGRWPKPKGISLSGRSVALVGLGDIGCCLAKRLQASEMNVIAYDPVARLGASGTEVARADWPDRLDEADFIVFTCSLTESSRHMLNHDTLCLARDGVRIVNVSRGGIIDEVALAKALENEKVHSAALDVFEVEPLPAASPLRIQKHCIFGSHNASNTEDAVVRTSKLAMERMFEFLEVKQ